MKSETREISKKSLDFDLTNNSEFNKQGLLTWTGAGGGGYSSGGGGGVFNTGGGVGQSQYYTATSINLNQAN